MELKEALGKLEESKEFKAWNKKTQDTFFSYAMKVIEENQEQPWNFGFYRKSTDKIVAFTIDKEIEKQEEEEIFKQEDTEVKPIQIKEAEMRASASRGGDEMDFVINIAALMRPARKRETTLSNRWNLRIVSLS